MLEILHNPPVIKDVFYLNRWRRTKTGVPLQEVIETTQVITHQHSSQVGTKKYMYRTACCTRTTGKYVLSADDGCLKFIKMFEQMIEIFRQTVRMFYLTLATFPSCIL